MAGRSESSTIAKNTERSRVPGHTLGIRSTAVIRVAGKLQRGLPFTAVERLRKASGLSLDAIGLVTQIPPRTMARRKKDGRLTSPESERLYRLAVLFEQAAELFEGNGDAARKWLESPNRALAGRSPLEMAETEIGAREVENLIGRLEHGVFS